MSIDQIAAYGEPFPEDFDSWHPDDQHKWKREKAMNVLLGNQTNEFLNLAGDIGSRISIPDPAPTFSQRRAMGDTNVVHPTSSTTPISPHLASALSNLGLTGFTNIGEALAHVRNTAQYLGVPVGKTQRITSSGNLTNEASRFLAQQADESARGQRAFTGEEARLFDEAHTLHKQMIALMERGHTGMTLPSVISSLEKRDRSTRPTIVNESLDVTPAMDRERKARATGEPVPTSAKTTQTEKEFEERSRQQRKSGTRRSEPTLSIPPIVYDPKIHTPELHQKLIDLQIKSELAYDPAVHTPKKYIKLANAHIKAKEEEKQRKMDARSQPVYPPPREEIEVSIPMSIKNEPTLEEKQANLAHIAMRQEEDRRAKESVNKRWRMEPTDTNLRPYTGQALGIQLPDGRIVPLPEHQHHNVVVGAPTSLGGTPYVVGKAGMDLDLPRHEARLAPRILDHTPMTNYPIVEL